jgi:predicted DNA-binding transcriptional regulator YafY
MRRADRLFQIVNVLRRRRTVTTATHLAERLGVSERTVYRDMRDLILAGTPIDGEAGVGYRIRPGYDLPPLMFDRDEIQALVLGARIVRQFGDPALARASDAILGKVAAIVPKDLAPLLADTRLFVPSTSALGIGRRWRARARSVIAPQARVLYAKADGAATNRTVRLRDLLLGPTYLAAWCELENLNFRLDRVAASTLPRRDVRGRGGQDAPRHAGALRPEAVR